jgi:endoglucanase
VNGTAAAGTDYASTSGTLAWADGDSSARTIVVPVSPQGASKHFGFNLVSVAGAAALGSPTSATVTLASTTAASSSSSSSSGTSAFSIAVSGNRLANGSGKTVQLRGAAVAGLESGIIFGAGNTYWSSSGFNGRPDFTKLAAWKLNVVRLPVNEDSWLGKSVTGMAGNVITLNGPAYQAEVAASVKAANATGLYVILDLHWSAPANFIANVQNPMADADNSVAFWTSVANAFMNNPAVIFELFNEPYFDPVSQADGAFNNVTGGFPNTTTNEMIRNGGTPSYYFGLSSGTRGGSEQKVSYT